MLVGDVAMICEGIICKTCVEIISGRLAVSMDLWGRDGMLWKSIFVSTSVDRNFVHPKNI